MNTLYLYSPSRVASRVVRCPVWSWCGRSWRCVSRGAVPCIIWHSPLVLCIIRIKIVLKLIMYCVLANPDINIKNKVGLAQFFGGGGTEGDLWIRLQIHWIHCVSASVIDTLDTHLPCRVVGCGLWVVGCGRVNK